MTTVLWRRKASLVPGAETIENIGDRERVFLVKREPHAFNGKIFPRRASLQIELARFRKNPTRLKPFPFRGFRGTVCFGLPFRTMRRCGNGWVDTAPAFG